MRQGQARGFDSPTHNARPARHTSDGARSTAHNQVRIHGGEGGQGVLRAAQPTAGRSGQESRSGGGIVTPSVGGMNKWVRQVHRWLSVAFTVTVVVCFVAIAQQDPAAWIFYLPLPPLALLMLTGLYMFVLPYARRRREARPV
nr:hypothetical protein GCM10020063_029750 [Dactylosporangium thailandense]